MWLPGAGRLRKTVNRLRGRWASATLVLMYHRVAELCSDPFLLAVTPKHFAEHMEVLGKLARPVRLQQAARGLREGVLPRRGVVVTFDDGYADNLLQAKPILERFDVPATVFVTSGFVGGDQEFWWDELDRLLLQPGDLPRTLRIAVNGAAVEADLGDGARLSPEAYGRECRWHVLMTEDPGPRQRLCRSLADAIRPLHQVERRRVLGELAQWAGVGVKGRASHRTLTADELIRLAEGRLVEVGAHTVTHPLLAARDLADQHGEILTSKASLETLLDIPVESFAYPFGGLADYTPETAAAVRDAGFTCACSNYGGLIRPGADPFQLPRRMVLDWDGDEFARHVHEWFRQEAG